MARARAAYATQDWPTAAASFDALAADQLTGDDLAAYADTLWWMGRTEDNLRLGAAAYDAFVAESRPADAAMAATLLGIFRLSRGDEPRAAHEHPGPRLGWGFTFRSGC